MTEEQKEILIAKMLDAPSSLSDEDLDSILHDYELRDIYNVSAAISGASVRQPQLDMKAEWDRFRPRICRKPSMMSWVMQVAAIFIGVLLVSGIVFKIVDHVLTGERQSVIARVEPRPKVDDVPSMSDEAAGEEQTVAPNCISVANQNPMQVQAQQSAAQDIPVEAEVDVDEYLRVQQARIDNDLAMQAAESYIEGYDGVVAMLDAAGGCIPMHDSVIRKVTME